MMKSGLPWSSDRGGIGGHEALDTDPGVENTPIIFIHGNSGHHGHWLEHIDYLLDRGFTGDELWAVNISNSELTHRAFASRIDEFVANVIRYTNVEKVSLVSHSLGVTSARYWMEAYDAYRFVENFVGIAGANHGIPTAPPDKVSRNLPDNSVARPSEFLSPFSTGEYQYKSLNENTETPGNIDYYTIRGSEDKLYSLKSDSPRLEGAECNIELEEDHFGAKDSEISKELIYQWCS